jgi:hypothetical protein
MVIPQSDINLFFDDLMQAQKMANRVTAISIGYLSIGNTDINGITLGQIQSGSRIEANGILYEEIGNADITDNHTINVQNYIYAIPDEETGLRYELKANVPNWNPMKNGWYYNGIERAIIKLFVTNAGYNGKVILSSFDSMMTVNRAQVIPTSGGVLTLNSTQSSWREAGAYRFYLVGGWSGYGGYGQTNGTGNGAGEVVSGTFFWGGGTMITKRGRRGGNGGNGGSHMGDRIGGGGGGGAGGCTIIQGIAIARGNYGGAGGIGSEGHDHGASGGGGGYPGGGSYGKGSGGGLAGGMGQGWDDVGNGNDVSGGGGGAYGGGNGHPGSPNYTGSGGGGMGLADSAEETGTVQVYRLW